MLASWHFEWIRAMVVSGHVCGSGTDPPDAVCRCLLVSYLAPSFGVLSGFVHSTCPLSASHSAPTHCTFSSLARTPPRGPRVCLLFMVITGTNGALAGEGWLSFSTVALSHCRVTAVDCGAKVCEPCSAEHWLWGTDGWYLEWWTICVVRGGLEGLNPALWCFGVLFL